MEGELVAVMAWKPYASLEETQRAIDELEAKPTIESHKYYLALPIQYLEKLSKSNTSDHLIYGAVSMPSVVAGSFTATIAGKMLKQLGARFVLLGTAYTRQLGDRENETIRQKIFKAIDAEIVPFLCIGENIQDYDSGRSEEVLRRQLSECVKDFTSREWKALKIVYEAPWINATSSMPSWDTLNQAYRQCCHLVKEICGMPIPVLCGVPDDITDLIAFVEGVQAKGYFFSHASLHLDLFSQGLHLSLPIKEVSPPPVDDVKDTISAAETAIAETPIGGEEVAKEETEEVAEVVGTAVLSAAHEVEEAEDEFEEYLEETKEDSDTSSEEEGKTK